MRDDKEPNKNPLNHCGLISAAWRIVVPSQSEKVITAPCDEACEFFFEPEELLFTRGRVRLTNGAVSAKANEPLNTIAPSFAKQQMELVKGITLRYAIQHPAEVYRLGQASEDFTRHVTLKADRPEEEKAKISLSQIDLHGFTAKRAGAHSHFA